MEGTVEYPDENFAREIMQLFSVGLSKLNPDGRTVLEVIVLAQLYDSVTRKTCIILHTMYV